MPQHSTLPSEKPSWMKPGLWKRLQEAEKSKTAISPDANPNPTKGLQEKGRCRSIEDVEGMIARDLQGKCSSFNGEHAFSFVTGFCVNCGLEKRKWNNSKP